MTSFEPGDTAVFTLVTMLVIVVVMVVTLQTEHEGALVGTTIAWSTVTLSQSTPGLA